MKKRDFNAVGYCFEISFFVYYAPTLKLERIFITCCASVSVNCPFEELAIKET